MLDIEGLKKKEITPSRVIEIENQKAYIFDDIFEDEFISSFASYVQNLDYTFKPSFDMELNARISNEEFEMLPIIPELFEYLITKYHSSMTSTPRPQQLSFVYGAAIRSGDSAKVHHDWACDCCVTFLYYGNLNWKGKWGGETVFYNSQIESLECISPRPGRLVMFNACLYHKAGIPARECPSHRYGISAFYRCPEAMKDGSSS